MHQNLLKSRFVLTILLKVSNVYWIYMIATIL